MIGGIDSCLDREQVLGIPNMGSDVFGHVLQRFEVAGKGFGVSPHHRVTGVTDIKPYGPIVGIHDRFNRVANVVPHSRHRLRIGIAVRGRVGIDDPEKPARVVNDQIGVTVEGWNGAIFLTRSWI